MHSVVIISLTGFQVLFLQEKTLKRDAKMLPAKGPEYTFSYIAGNHQNRQTSSCSLPDNNNKIDGITLRFIRLKDTLQHP